MSEIEIFNKVIKSKVFSGEKLSKFIAAESEFIDCSFEGMNIKDICFGAGIQKTKYINCSFDNSTFSSNVPGVARFEGCSFKNIKIKKFFCVDVEFVDCVFSGEIKQGNFLGVNKPLNGKPKVNEYRNNDFSQLNLVDVGFVSIDLTLQKFPKNDYLILITDMTKFLLACEIKAKSISDINLYDNAKLVINILSLESEGGNNQLLLDLNSFPKRLQKAAEFICHTD